MRLPDYEIVHDREGWFVACEEYDVCGTHRHTDYADAVKCRKRMEQEDYEAAQQEEELQNE